MKAQVISRSPVKDRLNLADVVPLPSPITVLVETVSVCNLRCSFCPTGDVVLSKSTGKYRGLMDMPLFEKIVSDIDEFPSPISVLHIQKDGEPLLHKEFVDMVSMAGSSQNIKRVETTTNGTMLNPDLNQRIVESPLARIKISVYGLSNQDFKETAGVEVDFKKYVENIKDLYLRKTKLQIYIKIMEEGLSQGQKDFFLETFGDICDTIFFEHCVENWPEFDSGNTLQTMSGNIGMLGQPVRAYKKVCPQPFYNLTVCADGTVTACCADWEVKLIVGNVKESSLLEIWKNDTFNDFRMMMLRGERKNHPVCGTCGYPTYTCVDDFDDEASLVLERFNKYG